MRSRLANSISFDQPNSASGAAVAEKRFVVAENAPGLWIVADRMGQAGGTFASKEAACRFVSRHNFGHPEEIDLLDEAVKNAAARPIAA